MLFSASSPLNTGASSYQFSSANRKHCRRVFVRPAGFLSPLLHALAARGAAGQGQAAADRQAGVWVERLQQGLQQSGVAVGRLDKQLGLAGFQRQRFEGADALGALVAALRQIADEGEVLAV